VDATLHADENGGWWMFVMISEDAQGPGALFLFMADSPLGPWRPHPLNPIQSDIRHTRPGGRLFHHEGKLLRPAKQTVGRVAFSTFAGMATGVGNSAGGSLNPYRVIALAAMPGAATYRWGVLRTARRTSGLSI
jgi:hypothetical protein